MHVKDMYFLESCTYACDATSHCYDNKIEKVTGVYVNCYVLLLRNYFPPFTHYLSRPM